MMIYAIAGRVPDAMPDQYPNTFLSYVKDFGMK